MAPFPRQSSSALSSLLRRIALCCAAVLLSWPMESRAGAGNETIDGMYHTVWTLKDGAPPDIWAITQTRDGWMWFGGPSGLHRFDGVTFESVETEPAGSDRSRAVSALMPLDSGELMIGYRNGGVAILRDGHATDYHEADGFDTGTVFDLTVDLDHRLYAATRSGLLRFDGRRWSRLGRSAGVPDGAAHTLMTDLDGRVWLSMHGHAFSLERGADVFRPRPDLESVMQFTQSLDGAIWYNTDTTLRLVPGQSTTRTQGRRGPAAVSGATLFDRNGALWSCWDIDLLHFAASEVHDGLSAWSPKKHKLPPGADHLYVGAVKTMLEDRDGNIWLSNVAGEIHQFRTVPLASTPVSTDLEVAGAMAATPEGSVWMAVLANYMSEVAGDGLWRLDGVTPRRVERKTFPSATAVFVPRDGDMRIASEGWLWRRRQGRFQHDLPLPMNDRSRSVIDGAMDPTSGSPWIAMLGAGLFQRRGNEWVPNGGIASLPPAGASALAFDADGNLWIGYSDGRVRRLRMNGDEAAVRVFDTHAGAIHVVAPGGLPLAAGDRGLALLDDRGAKSLQPGQPGAFDGITGLVFGANGDAWLNGSAGIVHVGASDLRDAARSDTTSPVRVRIYDQADGYPGNGAIQSPFGNTLVRDTAGTLWFSGALRPGRLDPARLRTDPATSPLFLRSITTSSGRLPAGEAAHLAAGTRDLQVDYTALNYAHPDRERFRYRLVGLSDAWTDAGPRRQAFFTNLGPGRYRFELQSHNETNDWSASIAAMSIDIPPTFLQSGTFVALCVLLAAIALHAAVQWRVRHATRSAKRKEHERMTARMSERERIAREIHDTLLQTVQSVAMMIGAAATLVRKGQPVAELLDRAASHTEQAVVDARDRVCELRHDDGARVDVLAELKAIGERLAGEPGAATFALSGSLSPLQADLAHEVLSVGREALINAYRHSRADHVSASVCADRCEVVLQIQDDGIGIDANARSMATRMGHWGLPGMQERARRLGGSLTVTAPASGGTLVELRFRVEHVVPA